MNRPPKTSAVSVALKIGVKNTFLYALHMVRIRSGYYVRRCPVGTWGDRRARTGVSPFALPSKEVLEALRPYSSGAIAAANRIKLGELPYFSTFWKPWPDWHADPITSFTFPKAHWSKIPSPSYKDADFKWVWEPSRFDWVFILGRAFAYTSDDSYAECFWTIFEDWTLKNPPNTGVNWWCGQECGLRIGALVWASAVFANSESSNAKRLGRLWEVVEKLADRVEAAVVYSIAQHNNHMLSESLGLYLAGVSLKQLPSAKRWRRKGRALLEKGLRELFLEDGSYIHSANNYARATLKHMAVAAPVASKQGEPFDSRLIAKLGNVAMLLFAMQDEETGRVPNYGPNDGTNIYCMNSADFGDFKPAIQTMGYLTFGKKVFPSGPHDEELAWFFGIEGLNAEVAGKQRSSHSAKEGGYYVLRSDSAFCMMRCHTHREIPGHADMLHLDFWVNGKDVLCDGGSYSYNDARDWYQHFRSTSAHNTVTVDGQDQMTRYRRFLWADWTEASLLDFGIDRMSGEHYGYVQIGLDTIHRREVHLQGKDLIVIDDIKNKSGTERGLDLFWHLARAQEWSKDGDSGAVDTTGLRIGVYCSLPNSVELLSGPDLDPLTLRSLRYGDEDPISVLRASARTCESFRWITMLGEDLPTLTDGGIDWHGTRFQLTPATF